MNKLYTVMSVVIKEVFIFLKTYIFKFDKTFSHEHFCVFKELFY